MSVIFLIAVTLLGASPGQPASISREAFLRIELESEGDLAEAALYLALVAEDQPWRKPLFETILKPGVTTLNQQLPPGRYYLVCGAPGYQLEYSAQLMLSAGEHKSEKLRLRRLEKLRGRLLTLAGEPIAEARVGHLRAFIDEFARRLSPLGEDHLRGNFEVRTDSSGRFALPALVGSRHFVWSQAEGFAPGPLRDVLLAEDSEEVEIRLRQGATLTVSLASSGSARRRGRLQVVPVERSSPEELWVWERSLPTTRLHWPALPPGDYQIRLQGPRWSSDREPAVVLATIALPEGSRREVEVRLPPAPEATIGADRELRLFVRHTHPTQLKDFELWQWLGEERRSASAILTTVSGGTLVEVATGCSGSAHYVLSNEPLVGSVRVAGGDTCHPSEHLMLYPRAELAGQITAPEDRSLPAAGLLQIDRCPVDPNSLAHPLLAVPFPLQSRGRFAAPAATGCLLVSLQIGDFSPLELGRIELQPGQRLDLGRHRLEHGGTLLVQVVSGADGLPLDGVVAEVIAAESIGTVASAAFQRRPYRPLQQQLTKDGGWGRFRGLPPGSFQLLLRPEDQSWPHISRVFEISPREETLLEGVILPSPSSLTVETVPTHQLAEELSSLEVVARRSREPVSAAHGVFLSEPVGELGVASFSKIPPGRWWLHALAGLRGGRTHPLGDLEVQIDPGTHEIVRLELDAMLFRGRLLYRGEPLQGSIDLTPFPFDGRPKVQGKADAEGRFQIPLAEPGNYHADIISPTLTTMVRVVDVSFQNPEEEVTIIVASGNISGRVLDAEGQLITGARIKAQSFQQMANQGAAPSIASVATRTDDEGAFRLEGLRSGHWTVIANFEEQESEPYTLEILADGAEEGVDLILRSSEKIHGTVVDETGRPVAGVSGSVLFQPIEVGELTTPVSWTSGEDGSFDLDVGEQAGRIANFILVAPERPVTALRTALSEMMTLGIPAAGGQVRLKRLAGPWEEVLTPSFPYILITEDGAFVSARLQGRARPSSEGPDILLLPNLAPGTWNLVALSSVAERNLLVAGAGNSLRPLAIFEVVPHQTVEVVVP